MNILVKNMHSNLKCGLVGNSNGILFNIKHDEVYVVGIYSIDRRQQSFALLRITLQNLQTIHGIRRLGKIFSNTIVLSNLGRWIVCSLTSNTLRWEVNVEPQNHSFPSNSSHSFSLFFHNKDAFSSLITGIYCIEEDI